MIADWKAIKLEDALNYVQPTNYIVESTDYNESFQTPVLTPGASFILGHTNEIEGVYKNVPTIIFDDFTTAFKFVDFPFKVKSSAMKILELKSSEYDIKFLYYLMLTLKFDAKQHKRYWISKYSKQIVNVPPLSEQQKIAAILDAADSLRQKDQQLVDHYTTLSQSLFLEMFGDPVTNPMGWEQKQLADISKFENGDRSSNYPSGDDIKPKGVLFLSTKNIISGKLNLNFTQYITEDKFKSLSKGKTVKRDLLITLRGTLGNCCIFDCSHDTAFINAQMMIIRVLDQTNPVYLHALVTSMSFHRMLQYIGKGAAVPQLTASQLAKLNIISPSKNLQNTFADRIQVIEAQKQQARANLEQSNDLFNSLLQRAFTGELTKSKAA